MSEGDMLKMFFSAEEKPHFGSCVSLLSLSSVFEEDLGLSEVDRKCLNIPLLLSGSQDM